MIIKCWKCGKQIEYNLEGAKLTYHFQRTCTVKDKKKAEPPETVWKRLYCDECMDEVKKEVELDKQQYIYYKNRVSFERAISIMEKQKLDFYEYEEAIKVVEEYAAENPEKFDSAHEIIAAIVLISNRIQTKIQHKIERYRVDFYLPDMKCILEIDGEQHDNKKNIMHDSRRDVKIREILGDDWEIVRIPTKHIETRCDLLVDAIEVMIAEKKKIRTKNNGIIPSYHSKRNEGYGYVSDAGMKKID